MENGWSFEKPSRWEGRAQRGEGEVRGAIVKISSPSLGFARPSRAREGDFSWESLQCKPDDLPR